MKQLFTFSIVILSTFFAKAQNVGIGTNSPLTKLHVEGVSANIATFNGGSGMWITLAESSTNRGYIGSFSGNPEDVDFGTYSTNVTGKLHLTTSNTPRLTIASAGNIGIGNTAPNSSAILDIASNTKGLLIPRMNSSARKAIASPAKGLIVYDSTTNGFWYYNNGWRNIMGNTSNADSSFYLGLSFIGGGPINSYNMTAASQSVFEEWGYLYDSGGPSGSYSNNENKTFSIQLNVDEALRLCILNNNLENPYDSLIINANGYSFKYVGTQTDTLYLFDHITGQVDIQFKSNGVNTAPGFAIRWDKMWDSVSTAPADPAPLAGWYFIPDKKTMLGGMNLFNSWNRNNVGNYSFSYGKGAVVKGDHSVAFGWDVLSEGGSFVWGFESSAKGGSFVAGSNSHSSNGYSNFILGNESSITGSNSYAFGGHNTISSNNSSAIGFSNINSGDESHAFGQYNQARGYHSMAMGFGSKTSGVNSIVLGMLSEATGVNSTAFGFNTIAAGNYSTTIGSSVTATGYASTAIGEYNDSLITSQSSPTTSTPAFMIGNGTAINQRSNAFLVMRTGRVHIDPQSKNNGNLDSNAILFGLYNATGEGISSKRTAGGNQYGIDFYTGGNNRLAITNGGTIQVTNNLTVQNGKGILRNTDGTQSKKLSTTVTVNTTFTAGQTLTFPITWPETFSSTPEAFVGNVTSGAGGWAEVVMTISGAGTSGATLYVYNPKTTSVSPNFSIKIIGIGPQ